MQIVGLTSELCDVEAKRLSLRGLLVARDDRARVEDELRGVVQTAQLVEEQPARAALVEGSRRLAEERVDLRRDAANLQHSSKLFSQSVLSAACAGVTSNSRSNLLTLRFFTFFSIVLLARA